MLTAWFRENARPLPWREKPTPYSILVSETMLQQTRIEAENALKQAKAAAAEAEKRAEETARAAEKAAGQIRQIELKEQEDLKKLKESAEAGAGGVRTRSGREEEKS